MSIENESTNQLNPEDARLVDLVVTTARDPQYLTLLNAHLTQAEESGWTALVYAIRNILAGERNIDRLGPLDKEDLHVTTAILEQLDNVTPVLGAPPATGTHPVTRPMDHDEGNYLQSVRSQYESYPYPKRVPLEERTNLFVTSTEHLGKINHYCFNGTRDLRQGGRFLVAGGGTGDAAIYLAEQLRNSDGEVVYLDLSNRSMEIARQRAEVRGLTNISWHQRSLLDLPALDLGRFHYINCCGVLHHLSDPAQGLRALSSVLTEDGCMAIMVYAQYGRTAIYQIQELMRYINKDEDDFQSCISNTRKVLGHLPDGNWYKRDEFRWRETLKEFGDIEIFDLFLHSQDRAYTVPEVYRFALENELDFVSFTGFTGQKLHYEFSRYVRDPEVVERIGKMPLVEQQAIAELINGCIKTHTFYLSRASCTLADPGNLDLVPYYAFQFAPCEALYSDLARSPTKPITINFGGGVEPLAIPQLPYTRFILRYINGELSIRDIIARAQSDARSAGLSPSGSDLETEFQRLFHRFFAYDMMLLRHHSIRPYKSDQQLAEETLKRK